MKTQHSACLLCDSLQTGRCKARGENMKPREGKHETPVRLHAGRRRAPHGEQHQTRVQERGNTKPGYGGPLFGGGSPHANNSQQGCTTALNSLSRLTGSRPRAPSRRAAFPLLRALQAPACRAALPLLHIFPQYLWSILATHEMLQTTKVPSGAKVSP